MSDGEKMTSNLWGLPHHPTKRTNTIAKRGSFMEKEDGAGCTPLVLPSSCWCPHIERRSFSFELCSASPNFTRPNDSSTVGTYRDHRLTTQKLSKLFSPLSCPEIVDWGEQLKLSVRGDCTQPKHILIGT